MCGFSACRKSAFFAVFPVTVLILYHEKTIVKRFIAYLYKYTKMAYNSCIKCINLHICMDEIISHAIF